ncbi:MAG: heavy metal-responsive transcriptional regulator [Pseudomonadota bacterium]
MNSYRIGKVSQMLDLSVDTLRYYEKIGLLPPVARAASRVRFYSDKDIAILKFIRRAQKMNFTLTEIGQLLSMREDPQHARDDVRKLTRRKLSEIEAHMEELDSLRKELKLLLDRCNSAQRGCPIIENIDH